MFRPRLLFGRIVVFVLLVQMQKTAYATISSISCAESCGSITIRYPFRLQTDHGSCGHSNYELSCENNVAAINMSSEDYAESFSSIKYFVKNINYDNFTIRLADSEVQKQNYCSVPTHSIIRGSTLYFDTEREYLLYQDWVFITCPRRPRQVISSNYVDTSSCNNGTAQYSYAVSGLFSVWDLEDSCRIDGIYITSLIPKDANNISYEDVHLSMVYGFEVSWFYSCCHNFTENRCNLDVRTLSEHCSTGSSTVQYGNLVSLLLQLGNSALGGLTAKLKWGRPFYGYLGLRGYIYALFCYALVLFVLYRGPLFVCGVVCGIIFLIKRWQKRHYSEYATVEEFLQSHNNMMPIRYSYSDLKKITNGFKQKLGEGGYGSVYKGKLRSGYFAAVKMLGKSKSNGQDFINEVATIGRIHHVNVVRLIGFCVEGSKRALIYEFMPNGSLDKYIFSQENGTTISIEKMYEISLGVARGIKYLHGGCDMQILHFDIKPHNILLDESLIPKVSDFGLAKLSPLDKSVVSLTAARGTMGYMAPELIYKSIGSISYKADVYSFGKLLMEMAVRRKVSSSEENMSQIYFPLWVHEQFIEGKDIELEGGTEEEKLIRKKMILVALWCVQMKPNDRPSMPKVIEMLESDIQSIEMPPKPYFNPWDHPPRDVFEVYQTQGLTNIPKSYLDSLSWIANGR